MLVCMLSACTLACRASQAAGAAPRDHISLADLEGRYNMKRAADLAEQSARFMQRAARGEISEDRPRGVRTIARTPSGRKAWMTDEKACALC